MAFEEIYRTYAGRLYSLLWRMVGSPAEAEDLLQEVFLQAFRKLESYRGEAALGTWLHRLAVNRSLDALRGRASRMTKATDSIDEPEALEPVAPGPVLTSIDPIDFERAIGQLPDGYRAVFVLHDVEGFEHREVADLLGIAEGTSKSQLHRARMRLRALLSGRPPAARGQE